ncbi:hypothetical protein KY325_03390 [Candidatus Woesearchaeota archaeon]|nr:hypothetical protein [Candidatus Woesearchaeota archaeon]MBW3018177.1 hypothetical protein [Candidatus Woesearchaeota archaeon]
MKAKNLIKPLIPSLLPRKRYIAFEILSENQIGDFKAVNEAILASFIRLAGEHGAAQADPVLVKNKWDPSKQKGVICINHKWIDHMKASLALMKEIRSKNVIVRSLTVSGMINKACKAM